MNLWQMCHWRTISIRNEWGRGFTRGIVHVVVWFLYLIVYGSLPLEWSSSIYHLFTDVLATAPFFWLLIVVTPIACVMPGFLIRQISR